MKPTWLIVVLLSVCIGLVFGDVRSHDFLSWDDDINYYENPLLDPVTPASYVAIWTKSIYRTYRPVSGTIIALTAECAHLPHPIVTPRGTASPLDPGVFHLASLALHIINVLLVFAVLRVLVSNEWAAAAGALLFGVHPLQVEAVAWASGLTDLCKGTFALLALWQYLLFARLRAAQPDGPVPGAARLHYAAALGSYLLGLLCHPAVAVTPLLAWSLDHWLIGRSKRDCTVALAPWLLPALPMALLTRGSESLAAAQSSVPMALRIQAPPLFERLFVAGDALAFYLGKLLYPVGLAIDYGRTPAAVLGQPWGHLTWLVPAAIFGAAFALRQRHPCLMAAGAVAGAALILNLGLVPFRFQYYSTVADRYVYLAMLAPALLLALSLELWPLKPLQGAVVIALFLLAFTCSLQTLVWSNDLTLFTSELEVNPRSWAGHNNLGVTLLLRGIAQSDRGEVNSAIEQLQTASRLRPDWSPSHRLLGMAFEFEHNLPAAAAQYTTAIALAPTDLAPRYGLASMLAQQGKSAAAAATYRDILKLDPHQTKAASRLRALTSRTPPVDAAGNILDRVR